MTKGWNDYKASYGRVRYRTAKQVNTANKSPRAWKSSTRLIIARLAAGECVCNASPSSLYVTSNNNAAMCRRLARQQT